MFWPEVNDIPGAEEAVRLCSWFAFANAALSAVSGVVLWMSGATGASGIVGAFVMAAIGFGVRRRWRAAAVAGAALLGIGLVVVLVRRSLPGVVDLLTLVAFLSGIRGTFALARLTRMEMKAAIPVDRSEIGV